MFVAVELEKVLPRIGKKERSETFPYGKAAGNRKKLKWG
jgi:hypothetical protein